MPTPYRCIKISYEVAFVAALIALSSCGGAASQNETMAAATGIDQFPASPTGYYAIYMASNNVVLYGKLDRLEGEYLTLTDVHYIRSSVDRDKKEVSNQIVRRSLEWHNPGETVLGTRHIMIIEAVAENSRVISLIRQMK